VQPLACPRKQVHAPAMLLDEIKARMFRAMKAGDVVEKEILRVAVGEITTEAARPGRKGSDEEAQALIRKLVKSNEESIAADPGPEKLSQLQRENEILASLLPRSMSEAEVLAALEGVKDAIVAAGNDGQATGVAMKHLKAAGTSVPVDGKVVSAAVRAIRGSA
jgi:uncharacterized protein YqeY